MDREPMDVYPSANREERCLHPLQIPVVVINILRFLPAKDLASCSETCSLWNGMVASTRKRRMGKDLLLFEMGRHFPPEEQEALLRKILRDQWCEPDLAIRFSVSDKQLNLRRKISNLGQTERHLYVESTVEMVSECEVQEAIEEAKAEFLNAKRGLPYTPKFLQLPMDEDSHLISTKGDTYCDPLIMLFPKIAGLDVQPFAILDEGNKYFDEFKSVFVSGENNSARSDAKCVVVFNSADDSSYDPLENTPLYDPRGNAIIIEVLVKYFFIRTGIAFAGERVSAHVVCIREKKCCIRQCFSQILRQNAEFNSASGLAYIRSRSWPYKTVYPRHFLVQGDDVLYLICKSLPNIRPLKMRRFRHVQDGFEVIHNVEYCNGCGNDGDETFVVEIVFLLFRGVGFRRIKVNG